MLTKETLLNTVLFPSSLLMFTLLSSRCNLNRKILAKTSGSTQASISTNEDAIVPAGETLRLCLLSFKYSLLTTTQDETALGAH